MDAVESLQVAGLLLALFVLVALVQLHRFTPYPGPCDYAMMVIDWVMSGFRTYLGRL